MAGDQGSRVRILLAAIGSAAILGLLMAVILLTGKAEEQRPQSGAPALSWETLRNASYPSEFPRSKVAQLTNGLYEEEYVPGAATKLVIRLADMAGFGSLDGDQSPDAAVILIADPGGSGTFVYLVAVLNDDGRASPVATVLLGDRVAVRSLKVTNGEVEVRMRVRGPTDPFARLTREVTRVYLLQDGELSLREETATETPSTPPQDFVRDPQRLDVAPGRRPVTVEGTLKPGQIADFVLLAEEGQELNLSLASQFNNAILSAFGLLTESNLVTRNEYATSWSGRIPTSQDYAVKVISLAGNDLKYTLTVTLSPSSGGGRPTGNTGAATPTPTAQPSRPAPNPPASLKLSGTVDLEERTLAEVSTEASQFLENRAPKWGLAVILPDERVVYVANPDEQMETASVVKVFIMLTLLDRALQEGRFVDEDEVELLVPMITESDNDSTTQIWNLIGGGRSVKSYLSRVGVAGVEPYSGPYWGTSLASARAVALVFAKLAFGDILDETSRAFALELLRRVVPPQRWGISAGAEGQGSDRDLVALKNGWYLAEEGWRVNSAGVIIPRDVNEDAFAVAIMTNNQRSWSYGIATIEGSAARIHTVLHGF